jgi:hypothetical protein
MTTESDAARWRELRPEVQAFAQLMEQKLRANDHKGGWKKEPPHFLVARACEEMAELVSTLSPDPKALETFAVARWQLHFAAQALTQYGEYLRVDGSDKTAAEGADVANFAMMLLDACGRLPLPVTLGAAAKERCDACDEPEPAHSGYCPNRTYTNEER